MMPALFARKASDADAPNLNPWRPAIFDHPFAASGLSGPGAMEPHVAKTFAPIQLGTFPQDSYNVGLRIAHVPTLAELTARLGALPPDALMAAVLAESRNLQGDDS